MRSGVNHAAHYIGGEWRGGTSSATADIINPATLESLGNIALAEQAEVAAAVDAASAAFPQWRRTPPQERIQYLFHFKQLLHQHADEIARITTMESRPFPEADGHQRDRRRKQATTEIFGPVLSLREAGSLDEAIEIIAANPYGNAASIFTTSGAAARKFRYDAPTGNIGVNIGVAAPMAYFPFSGWKDSFLGVLHGQGRDGVEFYTDKKVVVERWPREWSRKF